MVKSTNTEKKTYVLDLQNGEKRRVTVPANWKVTFGPTIPYSGKGGGAPYGQGTALRFYEGNKENLRAVFTDVKAFRDAGMEVVERRTQTKRKVVQKASHGGSKDVCVEAKISEWVNVDNEDDSENNTETSSKYYDKLLNSRALDE